MGEIGIPRREYLYELDYTDIVLIDRGYAARFRNPWSMTRWQTYYMMMSFVGSDEMRKSNIFSPKDLLEFPWEKDVPAISEDEVKELQEMMAEMNKKGK